MIDNLNGLALTFLRVSAYGTPSDRIADLAQRLCVADMGAAAVQRHMSAQYQEIVSLAKRWLYAQDAALNTYVSRFPYFNGSMGN